MRTLLLGAVLLLGGCAGEDISPLLGTYVGELRANDQATAAQINIVYGDGSDLALDLGDGCVVDIIEDETVPEGATPGYYFSQALPVNNCGPEIFLLHGTIRGAVLDWRANFRVDMTTTYPTSFTGSK